MPTRRGPREGQWYSHQDKGYPFQVIAVDRDDAMVELQHFDGDVDELDLDAWYDQDIVEIAPPEDWTGPMDDVEVDDLGYTETDMSPADWNRPLEEWQHIVDEDELTEGEMESEEPA